MPELPEVQTIVNDLNDKIVGRRITGVWFDTPKIIKKPKPGELEKQIRGLKVLEVKRKGKNILIYLTNGFLLLIHQKMTGHLLYGKWKVEGGTVKTLIRGSLTEKVNDYIHIIFYLDNGYDLALSDLRKFAKIMFGPKEEIENSPDLKKIGPDPLQKGFTLEKFKGIVHRNKAKIKQVLMNQEKIAGIGNIYSDETLWKAKIHPFKPAYKLSDKELKALYSAIKEVLARALKLRGTSISDYRDTAGKPGGYSNVRYVYRREGEPCSRCRTSIKRVKMGGRSAHFCPVCQVLK